MKENKHMSNEMHLVGATFHMGRGQEEAAKAALRETANVALEKKDMRAGDIQTMIDGTPEGEIEQLTLDQLVRTWGWSLLRDPDDKTGEIVGIDLLEDFSSDEETLFEVLGPFVTAGSYIDLEGKRFGGYWTTRYGFTGQKVVELEPGFPPIPLSLPQEPDDAGRQETEPESPAQLILRLNAALPTLWKALQHTPFDDALWAKVEGAGPWVISSLVNSVEEAASTVARQLDVEPHQALLLLLETAFQRLD
jgi:hypothetical protein